MSAQDCIAEIQKAAGRNLEPEELEDIITELRRRIRRARYEAQGQADHEVVLKAADDFGQEMVAAAIIERRNAAINARRRFEALDFVRSQFADDVALGVEALDVGVNRARQGSRLSADVAQRQLENYYLGGLEIDLRKAGVWRAIRRADETLQDDIADELEQIDLPGGRPGLTENADAQKIAGIIHKWQEIARNDENMAGAWVKKMPGYIVRQSHDIFKIRKAGYEAWRDFTGPKLDEKTFDGVDDREAFMRSVWENLASGVHQTTKGVPGLKGMANIARRASAERVLHFKAGEWKAYNTRFGRGSLLEAAVQGLSRSARNTGLMRVWGPNAEANRARVIDDLSGDLRDKPGLRQKLQEKARGDLSHTWAAISGADRIPGSEMAAQVGNAVRAWQSMSKLGAAVISSVTDIPVLATELRYQGNGFLSGMAEAFAGLTRGRTSLETREVLATLGVFFDHARGSMAGRFSPDEDIPGVMTKATRFFFKANGLEWWTDRLRATAALAMSHRLAFNKGTSWAGLNDDLKRTLGLFEIDGGRWDIIRKGATKMADERDYVTPEGIRELPDDLFTGYLKNKGLKVTKPRIRELRQEIEGQLRSYFVDRSEFAVVMPDARSRALMFRGSRGGTLEGEMWRYFWQFKAFPVAITQKVVGRELYGRGSNTLGQALRNGNGEMRGFTTLILANTMFGYGALAMKDMLKGREPRNPLDPKTWAAAFVQGGGAGIYGDFFFGEMRNRFGQGALDTFLGPTFGAATQLADIWGRLKSGEDFGAAGFQFAKNNAPFLNLFYTRVALDYLLLYDIQESINPGYLKRMERRVRKENDQGFILPPSQVVPHGGELLR